MGVRVTLGGLSEAQARPSDLLPASPDVQPPAPSPAPRPLRATMLPATIMD